MRTAHNELLPLVWLSILLLFGTSPLTGQTGQLTGAATTQSGDPVANAFVIATAGGAGAGASYNTRSAADGSFAFSNLPVDTYRICVQALHDLLLDPCQWSAAAPGGTVTSGQTLSLGTIQLAVGQRLHVKLIDDKGALAANQGHGKTPGAHVLIGVWTGTLFHPMRLRDKKGGAWSHDIVVPFDMPLNLTVTSTAFALTDAKGNNLNPATGASVPIQIAAGTVPDPIVFHITGLNGKGH